MAEPPFALPRRWPAVLSVSAGNRNYPPLTVGWTLLEALCLLDTSFLGLESIEGDLLTLCIELLLRSAVLFGLTFCVIFWERCFENRPLDSDAKLQFNLSVQRFSWRAGCSAGVWLRWTWFSPPNRC